MPRPVLDPGGIPPGSTFNVQSPADIKTAHAMLVSLAILLSGGLLLILVAGESEEAGNVIMVALGIMLFVQASTKASPLVEWVTAHPLTP